MQLEKYIQNFFSIADQDYKQLLLTALLPSKTIYLMEKKL